MAKQCPRCGYINADDANYCSSCGYPLSSSQPPFSPSPSPDRLSAAFNIFTRNLSMIMPTIILLIIEVILAAIIGVFGFILAPTALAIPIVTLLGIISGIIDAILFSITIHTTMYMAHDAINNISPNLNNAFSRARSTLYRLYTIIAILIVIGIIGVFAGIFVSWFLVGLVGIILYIISASVILDKQSSITAAIDWYGKALNRDAGGALVILIGSLFSLIPIINIFAIPYTSILAYLMVRDIPS
ncbi:MAG: zinc ribbon domain-containing protein [Saccharolobus sp.]